MIAGAFASLLFLLALTAGIYFFGYAARRTGAVFITSLEVIFGSVLIIPFVFVSDDLSIVGLFTKPSTDNWLWLGASSVFGYIGGNFFTIINLKWAGERTNSLLSPAITASAVVASAFVFGEHMNAVKICGVAITLSAVCFFLFSTTKNGEQQNSYKSIGSSIATIVCITLTIICSVRGTMGTQLSIMHTVWLRLVVALPFALIVLFRRHPVVAGIGSYKVYGAISAGVLVQTIIASYLWFYCTLKMGISTFQIIIATLPFFVFAADVCLFKRSKFSIYFLGTALIAVLGIWLVMRQGG